MFESLKEIVLNLLDQGPCWEFQSCTYPYSPTCTLFFIGGGSVGVADSLTYYSWLPWKVHGLTPPLPKWDVFKVILLYIYSFVYSLIDLTDIY